MTLTRRLLAERATPVFRFYLQITYFRGAAGLEFEPSLTDPDSVSMYLQLFLSVHELPANILKLYRGYCSLSTNVCGELVCLSVWFVECWAPAPALPVAPEPAHGFSLED